jgi:lipopolysaccharide/colanic/teichoic acid biosynthesis glycosyltransferase
MQVAAEARRRGCGRERDDRVRAQDAHVVPSGVEFGAGHLDRPQFWNVVRREMSLVGTRPLTVEEVGFTAAPPRGTLDEARHPTGLWQ